MNFNKNVKHFLYFLFLGAIFLSSCQTFRYKTYDVESSKDTVDQLPDYTITLDPDFQDFTTYMFIGNRIENFGSYFNTYYNATENFDDAFDDYVTRVLSTYGDKLDSIMDKPTLSQESIDKFNQCIEKSSKILLLHKSSEFLDLSVLLIGRSYYYLGDYLKAERKFSEFLSRLSTSTHVEEAILFMAKTQMRLDNFKPAIEKLDELIAKSKDREILSGAYQSKAEFYLSIKDYDNAINNFKKAIEFSTDNEFKAQMQFLVATVTERTNPTNAAAEYNKVLDYGVSFDLEYLAKYKYAKNLVVNKEFAKAINTIDDMEVKYKEIPQYLADVNYLRGMYLEQMKEMKQAINQYYNVIQMFPSTKPSSDASFRIGVYEENIKHDYLNAYRYYRFSIEQSPSGTYSNAAAEKSKTYKRYFELRSIISGSTINTDYDSTFKVRTSNITPDKLQQEIAPDKNLGKPGGLWGYGFSPSDSMKSESKSSDSLKNRDKDVSNAKYELAELFLYDLNRPDSSESYLKDAFESSGDYEFRAKVLFALANLYRNKNNEAGSEEVLKQILQEYPSSAVANSCRRLLNIQVDDAGLPDAADSLYFSAEERFLNKDYENALSKFKNIISNFSESKYLAKSLYASGWIYENIYMKPDTAYLYYSMLASKTPSSELYSVITPKIEEYNLFNNKNIDTSGTKDSLNVQDTIKNKIQEQKEIKMPDKKEGEINQPPDNGDPTGGDPSMKKDDPVLNTDDKKK
jgi:tetratricopeptide (TPR) repeat protein